MRRILLCVLVAIGVYKAYSTKFVRQNGIIDCHQKSCTTDYIVPKYAKEEHSSLDLELFTLLEASNSSQTLIANNIPDYQPCTASPSVVKLNLQQFVYLVLTSTLLTCLIVGDIVGVKLFEMKLPVSVLGFKTVEHTCGMLTFPVTFVLGDVINEYYGPKAARNAVYVGFSMAALVFVVLSVAQAMPFLDKPFNVNQEAFDMIFGSAKLMYVASLTAFLLGSLADIWLFGIIKQLTAGKLLWLRATGSTIISQCIDSFVVSYIAFSLGKTITGQPAATFPEVLKIAATGYGLKFFLAALMTPLLYIFKYYLSTSFGLQPIACKDACG